MDFKQEFRQAVIDALRYGFTQNISLLTRVKLSEEQKQSLIQEYTQ